jgi:WD40 repeat protein/tRNA A-37 threonylcarbamoyl transferase component Bud32
MADSIRDGLDPPPAPTSPHFPNPAADTDRLGEPPAAVADLPPTEPLVPPEATPTTPYRAPAGPAETFPRSFGAYELLRLIARGGMGAVYKARQTKLRRVVALKMILAGRFASDDEVRRFYHEAQAVAQLDHPGIVPVYEVGEHEGQHYFSMGYVEGGNLELRVREGPLPPRQAAALVERVAEAVGYAHGKGIVHRDLKPANVLLDAGGQPRVTDFGLARHLNGDGRLTVIGQVVGTPNFMPPEQATGSADVGPLADVYALGALLYYLLTGRPPFHAATPVETLRQVVEQEPVAPRLLNAAVDCDLETVCLCCLHKEPGRRYAGASALADDLGRFRRGEPIHARPVGRLERLRRWRRRNPAVAALLGALFMVLVAGLATVIWQWDEAVRQRRRAEEKTLDEARARADAERFAEEAGRKTQDEAHARVQAQRYAAGLLMERGLGLCQQGQYAGGLLWLARALEAAPEEADDMRDSLRTLLGGWSAHLCPCRLVLDHPRTVKAADLSADGRLVATASGDTAQVWDAETGRPIGPPLRHAARIHAVALSPDGRFVLTGGDDHVARLWETPTGRSIGGPLAHSKQVEHVAFSPDGKVALTGSLDGTARLWDTATGTPLGQPLAHTDVVRCIAFSPDGRLVATGSNDGTARLWEVPSGRPHGEPLRHQGAVRGLTFSPDGRQLLTGGNDPLARLWDTATGKPLAVFRHAKHVPGVAFRPDGLVVATGSEDRTAREWDARTGQPLGQPLVHENEVARVAYSPDGRVLLSAQWDHEVRLWEAGTDRPAFAPLWQRGGLTSVVLSRDGGTILTAGDDHTARLWHVPRPALHVPLPQHTGAVMVTAFSPDSTALLAASGRQAWLCEAATGKPLAGPLDHAGAVVAGTFSPDGRTVLTGCYDGTGWLWDAATGRRVAGPFRHPDPVWAVAFRPDGKAFATGSGHSVERDGHMVGVGEARVWDVANGEVIQSAPRQARDIIAVAFTPDGRTLLTASKDKTARFWDAATGAATGGVIHHDGWVNALALSPDGRAVLTGSDDRTARLWSVPDASPLTAPLRHARPVKAVGISPDGRLLLTTSEDATARLWEPRRGQPAAEPLRTPAPILSAALSPAGRTFVTGDRGGGLRLWRVPGPLQGDVERLRLWIEATSGTELDATGALRRLPPETWAERRRRLELLGGPPVGAGDWAAADPAPAQQKQ